MKTPNQYPDVEREIKAAFKWPTRICIGVCIVLLVVASLVVM